MKNERSNPTPSQSTRSKAPAGQPTRPTSAPVAPLPPGSIAITKAIHPGKLLDELHGLHGITGVLRKQGSQYALTLHDRPTAVTDAHIQAVITAHTPTPAADSPPAQLQNWNQLTAAQKDALLLAALKMVYGVP